MPRPSRGAAYLSPLPGRSKLASSRQKPFIAFLLAIVAFACLTSTLSYVEMPGHNANLTAKADDCDGDCDTKGLSNAWDSAGVSGDDAGFDELVNSPSKDNKSLSYAIKRQFTIGYLNNGQDAKVSDSLDWYKNIFEARGKSNCGGSYGKAGQPAYPGEADLTLYWHNCDVPNLVTEFAQDILYTIFEPGFYNAETEDVKSNLWFGFSSNTPDKVTRDGANITALEAFGYNLKYTSYRGEWDHIKVMTAARALSNFGFMDRLKLGVQAWANGLLGGVQAAAQGLVDDLKSGNLAVIITSPMRAIGRFLRGASASSINTIIDTSDTNVFAAQGWYRPEFGATIYNARQLSQAEISDYIQVQLAQYMVTLQSEKAKSEWQAKIPADLASINPSVLKTRPLPDAGYCGYTYDVSAKNSEAITRQIVTSEVFDTAANCRKSIDEIVAAKWPAADYVVNEVRIVGPVVNYIPSVTVGDWASGIDIAGITKKYGIYCALPAVDEGSADSALVTEFISCLDDAKVGWPAAKERATSTEQTKLDGGFFDQWLNDAKISEFLQKQAASFTAASARYICLDANGRDMKNADGTFTRLVIGKGANLRYNEKCSPVRAPIQNGFFGNGYDSNAKASVPVDTRRAAYSFSILDAFPITDPIANFGMSISNFTTRVANTALNMSFSPLLHQFGGDTIIVAMVEGFRDSLFFPLAALVIALAALSIFFQAGARRDYAAQAKSLLLIVLTFFSGAILMSNPAATVRLVDEIPSKVEAVIVGSIFSTDGGSNDNLCAAVTPASSGFDYFGQPVTYDPAAASRNLICENWRVFAFTPYVFGQWGTSYGNLNSANFHATGTQEQLVASHGAPTVALGAHNAESNWALYQLDQLSSGTVTTADPAAAKTVSADMYRLVDLQAGPRSGAGTDARYFESWSGNNPMQRILIGWLGALVSTVGSITVTVFAWGKIYITAISLLLILFLPFMFLIGLVPSMGRLKLKAYLMQIVSYMAMRIALVTMLAVMLRIITAVSMSTDNFLQYSILTMAVCLAMLLNRAEILKMIDSGLTKDGGFGKGFSMGEYVPRFIKQRTQSFVGSQKAGAIASVGGFMTGGVSGATEAYRKSAMFRSNNFHEMFARQGFDTASNILQTRKLVKEKSKNTYLEKLMEGGEDAARSRITGELENDERFQSMNTAQKHQEINRQMNRIREQAMGSSRKTRVAGNRLVRQSDRARVDEDLRTKAQIENVVNNSATAETDNPFAALGDPTARERHLSPRQKKKLDELENLFKDEFAKDQSKIDRREDKAEAKTAKQDARRVRSAEAQMSPEQVSEIAQASLDAAAQMAQDRAILQASAATLAASFADTNVANVVEESGRERRAYEKNEKRAEKALAQEAKVATAREKVVTAALSKSGEVKEARGAVDRLRQAYGDKTSEFDLLIRNDSSNPSVPTLLAEIAILETQLDTAKTNYYRIVDKVRNEA